MLLTDIIKSIEQKEKRYLFFLSLAVVTITVLPYFFGYLRTPVDMFYTGIHSLTPGDTNVYYSYLEQVKQGQFFFQDLFTSEPQNFPTINPFWLIIGLLAKIFHLPNWLAVQLSRLLLIPIFIYVAYLFIAYLFPEKQKRKTALFFLVFASGLGALLSPILEPIKYIAGGYYHWPMDLWVPEAVTFLSLYHLPHILASSIFFLLVFLLFLLAVESNLYRYSLTAGCFLLFWLWFHPFHFFTIFFVLLVYLFILSIKQRKISYQHLKHTLVVVLLALPAVFYHFLMIKVDPIAAGKAVQNILITPVPWLVMVSYGFFGMLAVVGLIIFLQAKQEKYFFIAIWFIVQLLLLYAPITFQRRLTQNFHFPVTILAIATLFFLYDSRIKKLSNRTAVLFLRNKMLLFFLFIILFAFSNIYVVVNDIILYQNQSYPFFYLSQDYQGAFSWLKTNQKENEVVFSDWVNGNFIPGNTGKKVYVGHGVETVNFEKKQEEVQWFYKKNEDDDQKYQFLKEKEITYVFYTDREKMLGVFNPENKKYLKVVFKNDKMAIYKVITAGVEETTTSLLR